MDQNKHVDNNIINYSDGNNYFNYETQSQNNKSEIEKINPHYNIDNICLKNNIDSMDKYVKEKYNIIDINKYNKKEFNFCVFFSYIICCCRNNHQIKYIKELRHKILSEKAIVLR